MDKFLKDVLNGEIIKTPEQIILENEYNKTHNIYQLAAVGGGFKSIRLAVYGKEGMIPHFHFYKGVSPKQGIPEGPDEKDNGCICILEPKYFIHPGHKEKMNRDEIKTLMEFLKSPMPNGLGTKWNHIITLWNENNPMCTQVSYDTPIPEYKHNMGSILAKHK